MQNAKALVSEKKIWRGKLLSLLLFGFYFTHGQTSVDTVKAKHSLAMKLKNPTADVMVLRMQDNLQFDAGTDGVTRNTLNIETTIPGEPYLNWKVVKHILAPVVYQEGKDNSSSKFGLGDIQFTGWLIANLRMNGWILGAGGIVNLPTATDELLGYRKLGAGPSTVITKQTGGWALGFLWNHIWSFAGPGEYDMSITLLNPWVSYVWLNTFSIDFETETRYDWHIDEWTIPLRFGISRMIQFNTLPLNFSIDGLHYVARGRVDPQWGMSVSIALVFDSRQRR